jgi:hypothetical protein
MARCLWVTSAAVGPGQKGDAGKSAYYAAGEDRAEGQGEQTWAIGAGSQPQMFPADARIESAIWPPQDWVKRLARYLRQDRRPRINMLTCA